MGKTSSDRGSGRLSQQVPFDWSIPPAKAVFTQLDLAVSVALRPLPAPSLVAGIDIAYSKNGRTGYAAIVVTRLPKGKIVQVHTAEGVVGYPYRPGLLAFREGPLTVAVLKKLTCRPDIFFFDGAGVAHPRRFGLASHIGVLFDIPTIGCAKTSLLPDFENPGPNPGDFTPLMLERDVLGVALRTRVGVQPVFVSPGHRVDLAGAIDIVMATVTRYRLPEPIRQAHRVANELRATSKRKT